MSKNQKLKKERIPNLISLMTSIHNIYLEKHEKVEMSPNKTSNSAGCGVISHFWNSKK